MVYFVNGATTGRLAGGIKTFTECKYIHAWRYIIASCCAGIHTPWSSCHWQCCVRLNRNSLDTWQPIAKFRASRQGALLIQSIACSLALCWPFITKAWIDEAFFALDGIGRPQNDWSAPLATCVTQFFCAASVLVISSQPGGWLSTWLCLCVCV